MPSPKEKRHPSFPGWQEGIGMNRVVHQWEHGLFTDWMMLGLPHFTCGKNKEDD